MMGYGFSFGGIWMILFVVFIVIIVVIIAKGPGTTRWPSSGTPLRHPSALQILEERYARGELNREEFLQRKHDLERGNDDKQN